MSIKIFFETDDSSTSYSFDEDEKGQRALGDLVFATLKGHCAYIMITPDDADEIMEETDELQT